MDSVLLWSKVYSECFSSRWMNWKVNSKIIFSIKRIEKLATAWEKIFTKDTSDKGLLSKLYKEVLKTQQLENNLITKWAKDSNRHLTKEDIQMANKRMKRWSTSYVITELQIKTRYHYTPIRKAKIQNTENTKCWKGSGATHTLICWWWQSRRGQPLWKTVWRGLIKLNYSYHTIQQMSWKCMFTYKPVPGCLQQLYS